MLVDSYRETPREEIVNTITHGLAAIASLAGLGAFMELCWNKPLALFATTIFGITLTLMYASSAIYHACYCPRLKPRLQNLDHVAIYLLIAGSYTPYCLLSLPGGQGIPLLGLVWLLAIAGSFFEVFEGQRFPALSLGLYLGLGWLAVVMLPHLVHSLCTPGLLWLIAGGVLYTAGSVFYARHWFLFSHSVWHLFVMAASACHFASVWLIALAH